MGQSRRNEAPPTWEFASPMEVPQALEAYRPAVNRQFNALAPLTQRFYARPPLRPRRELLAVIVPFESPQGASLTQLAELVAPDMERVNTTILTRTGSDVAMIPEVANHLISSGGKRLRPMLTLAMAKLAGYSGDGHIKFAAAVECMHTTTWSTKATCAAASSPPACCGATRRASWSAISCSARRSR